MIKGTLSDRIKSLVAEFGANKVLEEFQILAQAEEVADVCTILVNEGLHTFPEHLFQGEKYVVYKGSLDLTSEDEMNNHLKKCISDLGKFLRKKKWKRIFLIISGHTSVCMQVKLAIYRVTHIETTDWVFDGAGKYLRTNISLKDTLQQ